MYGEGRWRRALRNIQYYAPETLAFFYPLVVMLFIGARKALNWRTAFLRRSTNLSPSQDLSSLVNDSVSVWFMKSSHLCAWSKRGSRTKPLTERSDPATNSAACACTRASIRCARLIYRLGRVPGFNVASDSPTGGMGSHSGRGGAALGVFSVGLAMGGGCFGGIVILSDIAPALPNNDGGQGSAGSAFMRRSPRQDTGSLRTRSIQRRLPDRTNYRPSLSAPAPAPRVT